MNRKQMAILISMGANLFLILLRFLLAVASGSLALKANAWHSFSDLVVLAMVFLGLFLASQRNERIKGLIARAENIVAILVGLFILWMGLELFGEAISGNAPEMKHVTWTALGALFGVGITYFMGRYLLYVGKREQSPSLIAAGSHARMDMLCSTAALAGLSGSIFGMTGLDKVAATIVLVFIFLAALEILSTNIKALRAGTLTTLAPAHGTKLGRSGLAAAAGLALLCLLAYFASGFYVVRAGEQGLVRRFGTLISSPANPGIHYRWPYPFEKADMVSVSMARTVTLDKALLLTGDENLLEASITVRFRAKDAASFLLNATAPEQIVKNAAEASLRAVVGSSQIDVLMTEGRQGLCDATREIIQRELDKNAIGAQVEDVLIHSLAPPDDVKEAFEDVASAREDRATYINEAYSLRNAQIPKARGEAAETVAMAAAFKAEKINRAEGEASRFLKTEIEYANTRAVTRVRLYIEAMEKILPGVRKFLVGPGVQTEGSDLWFVAPGAELPMSDQI